MVGISAYAYDLIANWLGSYNKNMIHGESEKRSELVILQTRYNMRPQTKINIMQASLSKHITRGAWSINRTWSLKKLVNFK